MNSIAPPGRKCRICRKTGLPPFVKDHPACREALPMDEAAKRFCIKCDRTLRKRRVESAGPGFDSLCIPCQRAPVQHLFPCSNPSCAYQCYGPGNHCKRCRRVAANAASPLKPCRKCKQDKVPRGRGRAVCDDCNARGHRRNRGRPTGDLTSLDAVGAELELSHEAIRQAELAALARFRKHWHALIELPEQAGFKVDWDWVFGKKDANIIDMRL